MKCSSTAANNVIQPTRSLRCSASGTCWSDRSDRVSGAAACSTLHVLSCPGRQSGRLRLRHCRLRARDHRARRHDRREIEALNRAAREQTDAVAPHVLRAGQYRFVPVELLPLVEAELRRRGYLTREVTAHAS